MISFAPLKWKPPVLHMMPWCLENPATDDDDEALNPREASHQPVRVVASDGKVKLYKTPVYASEVMRELGDGGRHMVCSSDAFLIGQRVPPLAAGEKLQPGKSYFLLPASFFDHSVLSFVSLASSLLALLTADGRAKKAMMTSKPFEFRKTPSGMLQVRVCDEFLTENVRSDEQEEEKEEAGIKSRSAAGFRVCDTEQLEKEYKEMVGWCKERKWKPKLEAIDESLERTRNRSSNESEHQPRVLFLVRRFVARTRGKRRIANDN